jgi:hypothetical protein
MKRSVGVIGVVVFLAVVLAAGVIFAQQPAAKLPDFTIDKIYLTKDCMVAVVVKNLGPGPVPDAVWTVHTPKSASVYLYKNGTGWGGATIWLFDPAKNLKAPGGTATYTSTLKVTGAAAIKAVVDLWNVVPEANEGNNSLETKVACEVQTGPCCIAGTYDGVHKDTASATCSHPSTEKFILTITQIACSHVVNGEVETIKGGVPTHTHHLGGVVEPADKCCRLKGNLTEIPATSTAAGKVIPITATFCKKDGKWYCTDGVYTNPTGCSGTFTLKQK